ncbi:MAG: hypothetical protein QM750_00195 [Rubrivivax sp.]
MADTDRDQALQAGVLALTGMLAVVNAMTDVDLNEARALDPGDDSDPRDYRAAGAAIRGALLYNLNHRNEDHREGFLRALTDMFCILVDGACPDLEDWDPIANTAASFADSQPAEDSRRGTHG